MSTLVFTETRQEGMQGWRKQIGHRHRLAAERGPRPFAVISYLVYGFSAVPGRIPLRQLSLVALFDEQLATGELATRVIGVAGEVGLEGLRFGGPELSRFDKDLRLAPAAHGHGLRFDATDGDLLQVALGLEGYLERCARHPYFPRRRVPRLPELVNRQDSGFVDLTAFPKRQIITVSSPQNDLCGSSGTTEFDFYHT